MGTKRRPFLMQRSQMPLRQPHVNDYAIAFIGAIEDFPVGRQIGQHSPIGNAGFHVQVGKRATQCFAGRVVQPVEPFT